MEKIIKLNKKIYSGTDCMDINYNGIIRDMKNISFNTPLYECISNSIEAGFKTVLSGDIINAPINIGDQVFIYQGGYKLIRGIYGIGIVQDILTSKRHYNENYAVITLHHQGQKDKPVVYYYDNARAILYNRILAARRKGYSQLSDNDVKIIKDCIK